MAIEDVLQQLHNNLTRDYISSGVIGLDGFHLAFDSIDPAHDEVKSAAELADGLKDMTDMVRDLDSGNINYIIISTNQYKIFLSPINENSKYFNSLTIKADGNIGKALMELEKAKKHLQTELE